MFFFEKNNIVNSSAMKEITTILFPTDFSEPAQHAFKYCLWLAEKYSAQIRLLHVIYPEYEAMDLPVVATQATRAKINAAKEALQAFIDLGMAQAKAGGFGRQVEIVTDLEIGGPVNSIVQVAERDDVDLIVLGTRGEHNALERTFGSVTTGVVGRAHCPVWIVPEHAQKEDIHVAVYASNLADCDPYYIWKVGKMLEPFSPVLHCVHVNMDGSVERVLDFADLGAIFAQKVPTLQINFQTLEGDTVTDAIEEFADNYDADLVIMLSPHYGWVEGLFHRSQTRKMALHTRVPLLVLKEKE